MRLNELLGEDRIKSLERVDFRFKNWEGRKTSRNEANYPFFPCK